jgi:hypothetical protein
VRTTTTTCPNGHDSTTDDYCDTCGAVIGATAAPAATPGPGEDPVAPDPAAASAQRCPSCDSPTTGRFCEDCGYDVERGLPAGGVVRLQLSADRARWETMVGADGEPQFPASPATATFELAGDEVRIGRAKPGNPVDIPIGGPVADPGVSADQCTFRRTAAGWVVVDDGSANGTWINGAEVPLTPGTEHLLASGDIIGIGAWTVLRVEIA